MILNDSTTAELIRVANELADSARPVTLAHFRASGLVTDNKEENGFDPVTIADRDAEKAMRAILKRDRPEDGIIGEEFGHQRGTSGLTWVLDPIDGTRGYISGTPTWGVLIAVGDADGPFLGVIDQPYISERFIGGLGLAEVTGPMDTQVLKTRAPRALSDATVLTTFPEVGDPVEQKAFHAVAAQAKLTRYGMDCYAYALLAAGQIDLVIEAGLNAYDIQAPIAIITAAGGVVTDWEGGPVHDGGRVIAAANTDIHAEALAIIQASVAG